METFKYLQKEGDNYVLKGQKSLSAGIVLLEVALAVASFVAYFGNTEDTYYLLFALLLLLFAFLTLKRMGQKIVFNPTDRTVTFPKLGKGEGAVLGFDEFSNFTMVKLKSYGITTNNHFQMTFKKNGKDKSYLLRQYGTNAKQAQVLAEEIEQIMGIKK